MIEAHPEPKAKTVDEHVKLNELRQRMLDMPRDREREAQARFHATLTTLSAGAIALSITFIEKIASTQPRAKLLMLAAWGCFAFALTCSLLAARFSTVYWAKLAVQISDVFYGGDSITPAQEKARSEIHSAINWAEVIALFMCVLGTILLVVFAFINM